MLPVYLYYGDRYREYRQHTHKEPPMKYTIKPADAEINTGRVVPVAYVIEPVRKRHEYDWWELVPENCGTRILFHARYAENYRSKRTPGASWWIVTEHPCGTIEAVGIDTYGRHLTDIITA